MSDITQSRSILPTTTRSEIMQTIEENHTIIVKCRNAIDILRESSDDALSPEVFRTLTERIDRAQQDNVQLNAILRTNFRAKCVMCGEVSETELRADMYMCGRHGDSDVEVILQK